MPKPSIGVWLIGTRGGVASTTLVGLCALKKRLIEPWGLVSELDRFSNLNSPGWDDFVVGGHEIRPVSLADEALRLSTESRAIDANLIAQCKAELDRIDRRVRPGTIWNVGPTVANLAGPEVPRRESPAAAIARLRKDMTDFAETNALKHVIVVNVASTEPPTEAEGLPARWAELQQSIGRPRTCPLRASSLYAIAALESGYSYINFTPSLGSAPEAIHELAVSRGTRHMGCDGKTGETLLKSVLAPMFTRSSLRGAAMRSWKMLKRKAI